MSQGHTLRHGAVQQDIFIQNLIRFRTQQKLTQAELALKAGLSKSRLEKVESAQNQPAFDVIVALCKALKVSSSELIGI